MHIGKFRDVCLQMIHIIFSSEAVTLTLQTHSTSTNSYMETHVNINVAQKVKLGGMNMTPGSIA